MSRTLSVSVDDPKGREVWVACGSCGRVTCHRALTLVATSDQSPGDEISVRKDFLTIQCGGCRTVSFCVQSSCSEDLWFNPETQREELSISHRVYPSRVAGRSELEHSHLLPFTIYRVYQETVAAICNDQPVLAGIGIRAIIETVCKDRSASGRDLTAKIDQLAAMGIVTAGGAAILHNLRFMGNEAAHEVKAHTNDELVTALDIAEYTLQGVYVLPKIAEKLPQQQPPSALPQQPSSTPPPVR